MKNHLLSILAVLILGVVISLHTNAQQTSAVSSKKNVDADNWTAAKINNGSNIINGVEFYKKSITNLIKSVSILKVVNTNPYSVRIQWEESAGVKKEIIIPANTSVEGNPDAVDKESGESKLVFSDKLSDEAKKLLLSSISVTQAE